MAANLDLFRMHLHRQPNINTKLDLRMMYYSVMTQAYSEKEIPS